MKILNGKSLRRQTKKAGMNEKYLRFLGLKVEDNLTMGGLKFDNKKNLRRFRDYFMSQLLKEARSDLK